MACTTDVQQDPLVVERQCTEAAEWLLARHGWRLLECEELARRAAGHLREGAARDARRAATHAYCLVLHATCAGAAGHERRELAYAELFRYLYDGARRRYPTVAEEVAQDALERVYLTFGRCRQPGAFLAFALQHLMDAARVASRDRARQARSLSTPVGIDGGDTLGDLLPDPQQPDPAAMALDEERRARLVELWGELGRRHPRARNQLDALWLKHVEGLDDDSIGRKLGKSVGNVHVLRSRGIARLRTEPEWQAFARECGIMEEVPNVAAVGDRVLSPPLRATARTSEGAALRQQGEGEE